MKMSPLTGLAVALLGTAMVFSNCKKEDLPYKYEVQNLSLPATPYNYQAPSMPDHMGMTATMLKSKVTDKGATLGRVLFYDTKLSLNNKIACASCHFQENGFSDVVQFSTGFDGQKTSRNASAIVNPIESGAFFWDGREKDLNSMALKPIENHIEMGLDNFEAMEKKLVAAGYYDQLFTDAYGDKKVTSERVADALRQFLESMVSANSTFDKSKPGGWGGSGDPLVFNGAERRGNDLFFGKAGCANCHNPVNNGFDFFGGTGARWEDIGLEVNYTDKGLGENEPGKEGLFKVPQLRNIALTAPYMHDGRFATLRDVVNHYSENVQPSANLSWPLRGGDGNPLRLNLTEAEKDDLVAFLGSFTDKEFINDPKFSNPFK